MPPTQTGQAYRLAPNRWGLRYYDRDGARRRKSPFPSKSAALAHYRNHIEPQLRGEPAPLLGLTLSGLIDVYLERHAASVRPRTILTLRERLAYAERAFGTVPLGELERMSGEIASWQAQLPTRSSYGIVQALRQTLGAAVRWGYISRNPAILAGRNRQPAPRTVRAFTRGEVGRARARAARHLRLAAGVRRGDGAAARGVAGARAARRGPPWAAGERHAHGQRR